MDAADLAVIAWERGWRPVRLRPGEKRPADVDWNEPEAAWPGEQAIRSAFSGESWNVGLWHPQAVIVDVDDLDAWYALLDELDDAHPGTSATLAMAPRIWTDRGCHIFLAAAGGLQGMTLRPGVELKTGASGQQVVAPGSVVAGVERDGEVPATADLPEVPEGLREEVRAAKTRSDYDADDYEDTEAGIEGFRAMLTEDAKYGPLAEGETTATAFSGEPVTGRDNLVYLAASTSHDFGLTWETAYRLMVDEGWLVRRIAVGDGHPVDRDTVAFKLSRRHLGKENAPGWRVNAQHGHETADEAFADVPAAPTEGEAPAKRKKVSLILDGDTLEPPEMLVENLLPRYGITQIYGEPGSYKSFLALDLGRHVAAGKPWHGWQVTQQAVLYIAGEGKAGAKQRADAWLEYHDEEQAPFAITNEMPPLDGEELREWAEAIETEWREPGFIIVDTQHIAMLGMDENSSHDAGMFLRAMRALMERWGATILLVHHPDKQGGAGRGSTAVRGNLDAQYHVYRDEGTKLEVKLAQRKVKDAPEWERGPLAFKMDPIGNTLVVKPPEPEPESNASMTREAQMSEYEDEKTRRQRVLAAAVAEELSANVDGGSYIPATSDELARWVWSNHKSDLSMSWDDVKGTLKTPHDRLRANALSAHVHLTGPNEARKDRRRQALEWKFNPDAPAAFLGPTFAPDELPI